MRKARSNSWPGLSFRRSLRTSTQRPTRSFGGTDAALSIVAPNGFEQPSGRSPRLFLACLTTEEVRRKSPDIELGSHPSHFRVTLGIPPATGPRGTLPQLRDQIQRLFAFTFQCIFHGECLGR